MIQRPKKQIQQQIKQGKQNKWHPVDTFILSFKNENQHGKIDNRKTLPKQNIHKHLNYSALPEYEMQNRSTERYYRRRFPLGIKLT